MRFVSRQRVRQPALLTENFYMKWEQHWDRNVRQKMYPYFSDQLLISSVPRYVEETLSICQKILTLQGNCQQLI